MMSIKERAVTHIFMRKLRSIRNGIKTRKEAKLTNTLKIKLKKGSI